MMTYISEPKEQPGIGPTQVWYHILKLGSISSFSNLYIKLITHFSTSIPVKKSSSKLFSIT